MDTTPNRKHCHRRNIPNHAHFLTFSCYQRQPFLLSPLARQCLIQSLARALQYHDLHLWAWVFMPEHVHLIIYPQARDYAIAAILQSIKQPVSQRIVAHARKVAPAFLRRMADTPPGGNTAHYFWQRGGGYDRNLFTAQEIHEKIHYIHQNPVRRGLVSQPADWEFSSARDRLRLRQPPLLPLDQSLIPPLRIYPDR